MAEPRVSALKAKPRSDESGEVAASEVSKKKVVKAPKQDADAAQARERARQRSGADD
jgi:hypothetical protein